MAKTSGGNGGHGALNPSSDIQKFSAEEEIRKFGTVIGVNEKFGIVVYESHGNTKILFNKTEREKNPEVYDAAMEEIFDSHASLLPPDLRGMPYIPEFAKSDIYVALENMKDPKGALYAAEQWKAKLDAYQERLNSPDTNIEQLRDEVHKEYGKYLLRAVYQGVIDSKAQGTTSEKRYNVDVNLIGTEDLRTMHDRLSAVSQGTVSFPLSDPELQKALKQSLPENAAELNKFLVLYHEHAHHAKSGLHLNEAGADYYAAARLLQEYPGEATRNFLHAWEDFRALKVILKPDPKKADEVNLGENALYGYGSSFSFRDALGTPADKLLHMSEEEILERAAMMDSIVSRDKETVRHIEDKVRLEFHSEIKKLTGGDVSRQTPELCLKVLDEMLKKERLKTSGEDKPLEYGQVVHEDMLTMLRDAVERLAKRVEAGAANPLQSQEQPTAPSIAAPSSPKL